MVLVITIVLAIMLIRLITYRILKLLIYLLILYLSNHTHKKIYINGDVYPKRSNIPLVSSNIGQSNLWHRLNTNNFWLALSIIIIFN